MPVAKKSGAASSKQTVAKAAKVVSLSKNQGANKSVKSQKIYVIDTSVLLHDHNCIHSFEDNRIAIPITVLEELDKFKVGNEFKNFEARECIRIIDRLSEEHTLQDWIPLENGQGGTLRIILNASDDSAKNAESIFESRKNDHKILNAALKLQEEEPKCRVILVTKDINLRLKAKALSLPAEDFKTGKVKEAMIMYSGKSTIEGLDSEVIRKLYQEGRSEQTDVLGKEKQNNHFYIHYLHQLTYKYFRLF